MHNMERASARIHGSYANGRGVSIIHAHTVVDPDRRELVTTGLTDTIAAMDASIETEEAKTRFGYSIVRAAGNAALKEAEIDEYLVARICESELDPAWVLATDPTDVMSVASLMQAGRGVALRYHRLTIAAVNAD